MKNITATTLVIAAACAATTAHAATDKTNAAPVIPQSVFVDDPSKGRDPFFPDSTRRLTQIAQAAPTSTNSSGPIMVPMLPLSLKGISGVKGQLLAIVNNTTLAVGEAADVRCNGQAMKIMLREIRERSVLIEVVATGEIKELKLRDGI